MTTREVIESYFECVNSGRWDDYVELFAENIVMQEQLLGRIEGKADLAKGIEGLRGNPDFHNYPLEIITEGNIGVALWNIKSPKPNGEMLDLKGANYYTVENNKITYFANFHDTKPFE